MKVLRMFPMAMTALLLAACGSQAQPAGPSRAPASAPASAQSKSSWDEVLAAANKEGSVAVISVGAEAIRTSLTEGFKKRYPQINVDFALMPPSEPTPKLMTEFSANKMSTDVTLVGVNGYLPLMDAGALVDLHPYLTGPDTDESKQLNGKWHFADKASQYMLVFSAYVKLAWAYTADKVDGSQFKGWKDMLDPKWKGKIIMGDVTTPGAGSAMAAYWYQSPELGKPFVDQFFKQQEVKFSRDDTQMVNAVGHGESLIGIGISDTILANDLAKGLPIKVQPAANLTEKPYVTAGTGVLAVPKGAPHPNAAKVYINWLLSPEGQGLWSQSTGVPSFRQDAPHEGVLDAMVPKPGRDYFDTYSEDFARKQNEAGQYVKSLLNL
ncbi:MAG TPA: extracellular solute-binding protein [Chloroflexota bacterium]